MASTAAESGRIPVLSLSSDVLGAAEASRRFQEATQGAFLAWPSERHAMSEYRLEMRGVNLGAMVLVDCYSSPQRFERPKPMIAATGTDHILLQLYLSGGSSGSAEGREVCAREGDIWVYDLSRPRATLSGTFRNLSVVVPRTMLEDRGLDIDALHGLVLRREAPLTRVLAGHIEVLARHASAMSTAEAEAATGASAAIFAQLLVRRSGDLGPATAPKPRLRVLRHINAHLHDPDLGPAKLMAHFGMSRPALYRMFEADGGVAEIIRVRRLTRAAVALNEEGSDQRRISAIAHSLGFVDASSFSRAFRAHFGVSPSEARAGSTIVRERLRREGARGESAETSFAHWIRMLG